MKKIVLALILVGLMAGGAYWYLSSRSAAPKPSLALEALLPAETIGVMKVFDAKQQVERFKAGRMGQSLGKMDFPALLRLLEIPPEGQEKILRVKDQLQAAGNSAWFDLLFGQEFAVALQPLSFGKEFEPQQVADAMVLVARPKQPTQILESLNSLFARPLKIRTQAFKHWTISDFTLENGQPVYYTLADGLLLASPSQELVRRCLEQSLRPFSSLGDLEGYKAYGAELYREGQTDSFFYGDLRRSLEMVQQGLAALIREKPERAALQDSLKEMSGLETMGGAAYDDGSGLSHSKGIVRFDPARLSETLKLILGEAPGKLPPLQQVPARILFYSWQNFSLEAYWRQFSKSPELPPEAAAEMKQGFQNFTGVALDDFLAAFDSHLSILLADIRFEGMFPIPEVAVSLGVKDAALVKKVIAELVGRTGMPMARETYQGLEVASVPMGGGLSPSYTCDSAVCTIAINKSLLLRLLDAPKNANLAADAGFKAVDKGLSSKNSQVSFWNMSGILAKTREGLSWVESRMASAPPAKREKFRETVQLAVNPILDGLAGIKTLGSRTYVDGNKFVSDVYVASERP